MTTKVTFRQAPNPALRAAHSISWIESQDKHITVISDGVQVYAGTSSEEARDSIAKNVLGLKDFTADSTPFGEDSFSGLSEITRVETEEEEEAQTVND